MIRASHPDPEMTGACILWFAQLDPLLSYCHDAMLSFNFVCSWTSSCCSLQTTPMVDMHAYLVSERNEDTQSDHYSRWFVRCTRVRASVVLSKDHSLQFLVAWSDHRPILFEGLWSSGFALLYSLTLRHELLPTQSQRLNIIFSKTFSYSISIWQLLVTFENKREDLFLYILIFHSRRFLPVLLFHPQSIHTWFWWLSSICLGLNHKQTSCGAESPHCTDWLQVEFVYSLHLE